MSQNFKNANIYIITNDYKNDMYVGSTCNTLIRIHLLQYTYQNTPIAIHLLEGSTCDALVRRFSVHKCDARKHNDGALYNLVNETGESLELN